MKIVLAGFMGAGKSSVAKALSEKLGVPLYENDDEIVKRSGRASIPQIFEQDGEPVFRKLETELLAEGLKREAFVLSPGAGFIEDVANRELVASSGAKVIYLDTSFETICERLSVDEGRPLFQDKEAARERYLRRAPLYRAHADIIVPTDNRSISELRSLILRLLSKGAPASSGEMYAVIGDPVALSLSPRVHNAAFKDSGTDSDRLYGAMRIQTSELKAFCDLMRSGAVSGASCTMPHKLEILPYVDERSPAVKAIGAANTLTLRDGKIFAENTDWVGVVAPLKQAADLSGKKVAILGAGGTARAALYGLKKEGAEITLFNRSREKGEELSKEFEVDFYPLSEIQSVKGLEIVLNTTSVGMSGQLERSPVPAEIFSTEMIVMDAIYKPYYTLMLQMAEQGGARVIPGARMFLEQACAQFEIWTGGQAPRDVMAGVIAQEFERESI